jgi:hypothetical protein
MIRKLFLVLALSLFATSAFATCGAIPLTVKDASNATQSISSATAADGNCKTYIDADTSSQIHNDLAAAAPCQSFTTPTTSTPVTSNTVNKIGCDLNGNWYIAPQQLFTQGPATVTNSLSTIFPSQYPVNAVTTTPTPLVAKGSGTTAAITGTLTPAATATAYVCGFSVSAIGGTANPGPLVLSGILNGPFTYQMPVNSATNGQTFTQTFSPCLPASAVNTAIVMTTTAAAGATATDVNIWGYGL